MARTSTRVHLWAEEWQSATYLSQAARSLWVEHGCPDEAMGVYHVDGQDPRSALARSVELERFGGFFGDDAEILEESFGVYEQGGATEFLIVVDHREFIPAGVIRITQNTARFGTPILNDLQKVGKNGWGLSWDDIVAASDFAATNVSEFIDISTIAVSGNYTRRAHSSTVSQALCAAVLRHALRSTALTWVCSLDRVPYQLIQAYGADVMEEFDGVAAQPYYGSVDTVPLWCNFRQYAERLKVSNPDIYAAFIDGVGLEDYYFGWLEPDLAIDLTDTAQPRRTLVPSAVSSTAHPA